MRFWVSLSRGKAATESWVARSWRRSRDDHGSYRILAIVYTCTPDWVPEHAMHDTKRAISPRLTGPAVIALISGCLSFAAAAPLSAQYDAAAPEPIHGLEGSLFVGGGGELPAEVYDRLVELAGGDQAKIVVLVASAHAPGESLRELFTSRSPLSVRVIHSHSRATAKLERFVEPLREASAVWIDAESGALFAEVFQGTLVEAALIALIARGGVIGSNGEVSRALSKVMISGGHPQASLAVGLDLIPGAVIDVAFTGMKRRNRMLGVLAAQPSLVGLGIDARTAMILHHRFIDVLGEGSVYNCLAASPTRPLRIDQVNRELSPASQKRTRPAPSNGRSQGRRGGRGRRGRRGRGAADEPEAERAPPIWRPRRLADLIALSRSALARTVAPFPAEVPPAPKVESGTLMIVGGGGAPPGLLERFVEMAGGPDALLVYIPCSEAREISQEPRFLETLRRAGANKVTWIHTKDRDRANHDESLLAPLRVAGGIWFGGGRQWNLVDSYQNTTAHKLMHEVLARGGVIGGSSAGASIQASYMARGNPLGNVDPMAEGYDRGLGFLTGVAVDQHFTQRGRLPDMTALVDTYPQILGIGLDEASSIIVQGSVAEVFTREGRNVHFYDRRLPVVPGEPDYIQLVHGQRFDLRERKILEPGK